MAKKRQQVTTCDYASTRAHDADHVVDFLIIDQRIDDQGNPVGPPEVMAVSADECGEHAEALRTAVAKFVGNGRVIEPLHAVALASARIARAAKGPGRRRAAAEHKPAGSAFSGLAAAGASPAAAPVKGGAAMASLQA